MTRTGGFDVTVQLSEGCLAKIISSQHSLGVMPRRLEWIEGDKHRIVLVNCPSVALSPENSDLPVPRARFKTRLYWSERNVGANEVGEWAVLDVEVVARLVLVGGNPGAVAAKGPHLRIDWTAEDAMTITSHPPGSVFASKAAVTFAKLVRSAGIQETDLPTLGADDSPVGYVGMRCAMDVNSSYVTIGMNIGGTSKGSLAQLDARLTAHDWTVAVSRDCFVSQLQKALALHMPLPREIWRGCTTEAPWPWSGCWNFTRVVLRTLIVQLQDGHVRLSGRFHVANSGALVPDFDGMFTATIGLDIRGDGQIVGSVQSLTADLDGAEGWLLNFLAGDYFSSKLSESVNAALATRAGWPSFLNADQLGRIAAGKSRSNMDFHLAPRALHVDSDGILIAAELDAPHSATEPIASFTVTGASDDPDRFILDASSSIAPGDELISYLWEHSDGTIDVYHQTSARFIVDHVYTDTADFPSAALGLPSERSSCLTTSDRHGRFARFCMDVESSRSLVVDQISATEDALVRRVPMPPLAAHPLRRPRRRMREAIENAAPGHQVRIGIRQSVWPLASEIVFPDGATSISASFCVRAMGKPVPDAEIRVTSDQDVVAKGHTDSDGRYDWTAPVTRLHIESEPGTFESAIAQARLAVSASKAGFNSTTVQFWVASASERARLAAELGNSIKQLGLQFDGLRVSDEWRPEGHGRRWWPTGQILQRRITASLDKARTARDLLYGGSVINPLCELLGLDPPNPQRAAHELSALVEQIARDLDQLKRGAK